jgi:hypothetical protein
VSGFLLFSFTAVKQWKYEPYTENGQPKEVVFSVSLRFNKEGTQEKEIKK